MNSVYFQEQGAVCLHQNICLASRLSAMLNMKITLKESWRNVSRTDFLITPLSSAISGHSLIMVSQNNIRGWLMSSRLDFRVSHTQLQGNSLEPKIRATCGLQLGELSKLSDHDGCYWKMSQALLAVDISETFLKTFPKSGTMQNGKLYRRKKQAVATNVTGCGLWPTPTVFGNHNRRGVSNTSGDGLATAVKNYPTPTSSMMTIGDLEQARFSGNGGNRPEYKKANLYPTPLNRDWKNGKGKTQIERGRSPGSASLSEICQGNLNPNWVEWLMFWPIGWSGLKPLAELKWLDPSVDPHPSIARTTNITKNRINRIKAIGNGQVPLCASKAWEILS
jgi:hypothetical protein